MTKKQNIHLMAELWPNACRVQGWPVNDRALRLAKLGGFVGRELSSANDLDAHDDFDRVKKELLLLADKIPAPESGAVRGIKERMLHKIREELFPCIGIYRPGEGYLKRLLVERFKVLPHGHYSATQLLDNLQVSELRKVLYTFSNRLNYLRNEAGDTIHDMKLKANLPCGCKECRGFGAAEHFDEEIISTNENQPF